MNECKKQKIVGIVGGMGPRAVVEFFSKIVEQTPAKKDWEHIHIVIDNNTKIPSRTRHYLFDEESPVPSIVKSCQKLAEWPVDIIAIPCNSACHYLPLIQEEVSVPIANIMKIAVEELTAMYNKIIKCAVIGGRITYAEKTYSDFLRDKGIQYVHHDESLQKQVEETIEYIKLNGSKSPAQKKCQEILMTLQTQYNVDAVILGCTEFGCVCEEDVVKKDGLIIADSSSILANFLVKNAMLS